MNFVIPIDIGLQGGAAFDVSLVLAFIMYRGIVLYVVGVKDCKEGQRI